MVGVSKWRWNRWRNYIIDVLIAGLDQVFQIHLPCTQALGCLIRCCIWIITKPAVHFCLNSSAIRRMAPIMPCIRYRHTVVVGIHVKYFTSIS